MKIILRRMKMEVQCIYIYRYHAHSKYYPFTHSLVLPYSILSSCSSLANFHFGRKKKKKAVTPDLNPEGKSPVSFLQEYCHTILKTKPIYQSSIQDDPTKPFVTTVLINGIE